jgi:hypothetical protein
MGKQAAARSSVKLIELEQQMVAGAGVMTVPDAVFRQVRRARDATLEHRIPVQQDAAWRTRTRAYGPK